LTPKVEFVGGDLTAPIGVGQTFVSVTLQRGVKTGGEVVADHLHLDHPRPDAFVKGAFNLFKSLNDVERGGFGGHGGGQEDQERCSVKGPGK
jgi:hypothetical protein